MELTALCNGESNISAAICSREASQCHLQKIALLCDKAERFDFPLKDLPLQNGKFQVINLPAA
jgi:hypothetical protein